MSEINRLQKIMAQLRNPERGCPWDLKQTFETIIPHTLEEAYEVAYAIEQGDYDELKDELGDLLFQVIFYSQLAKEQELFEFNDVVEAICEKMLRRHPHVFDQEFTGEDDEQSIYRRWEDIKAQEKAHTAPNSVLDGLTRALPAMTLANKIQKKVAKVGFDWESSQQVIDKIEEELEEVKVELAKADNSARQHEEIGDLLFACVNLARKSNADPEQLLRKANQKFEMRFRDLELQITAQQLNISELPLEILEQYWQQAKKRVG